jgi:hypothetical protein
MAIPPVVDALTNLSNESSAVTKINQNAQRAADAIAKTLSTSDATQNSMNIPLDMNGQRILNLPDPVSGNDVLRFKDVDQFVRLPGPRGPQGFPGPGGPFPAGVVEATEFGCNAGNTAADNTRAINAAFAALLARYGRGSVLLPGGGVHFNGPIVIPGVAMGIRGASGGASGTVLINEAPGTDGIVLSKQSQFIQDLGFDLLTPAGPGDAGSTIVCTASESYINNIVVYKSYITISYRGVSQAIRTTQHYLNNLTCYQFYQAGIFCSWCNDIFINNIIFITSRGDDAQSGTLRLTELCEAITVCNADFVGGKYGLITDAANFVGSQRPAECRFTNVYFDSHGSGSRINKSFGLTFIGCWFSGAQPSDLASLEITNSYSTKFIGTDFKLGGGNGCNVFATCRDTTFVGCAFANNGQHKASSNGLDIAVGTQRFTVMNCTGNNTSVQSGQQTRDIAVNASCSYYTIAFNMMSAIVEADTTGTQRYVANNW